MLSMPLLSLLFILFLSIGYMTYGRWVAGQFNLNPKAKTPAHLKNDGVDYVPTHPFTLFGQHFSAISAAGPIAGPIIAGLQFGWLPALLWIALGVVFIGAVHDFSSLVASVKNDACSIADLARQKISKRAGLALMSFIFIALIYILVAFTDVTASSFVFAPEEMKGLATSFHPGGAVAGASLFYLCACLCLGFLERYFKLKIWIMSLLALPIIAGSCWLGVQFSSYFILEMKWWVILIALYCAIASSIPTWALLSPRGLLGGFVLYSAILLGLFGLLFSGKSIQMPALQENIQWFGGTQGLFPFLFVTIACGACSGFHGLVCSGTTSKQLGHEHHAHPIGYGAMLCEAIVAFIALGLIMVAAPGSLKGMKPGTIYGQGIGEFLSMIIGSEHRQLAVTFGAMAFSTFVFDTLDVATRLGRYLFQEFTGLKGKGGAFLGTMALLLPATVFLLASGEGQWARFWGLFGASNQLLAALTLLSLTLWLKESRRPITITFIPMIFVLGATLYALIELMIDGFKTTQGFDASMAISMTSALLIFLALLLAFEARSRLSGKK